MNITETHIKNAEAKLQKDARFFNPIFLLAAIEAACERIAALESAAAPAAPAPSPAPAPAPAPAAPASAGEAPAGAFPPVIAATV